jgi:hypothetical protein
MVDKAKVKGGKARAEALTPEERKAIARKAALARWDADVPQATHEGRFPLGGADVSAAVLENGKRLLTQATFLRALGRSRSPKAGTGVFSTVDGLPFFLQADVLKPFISDDLRMSTTPIFFKTKDGKRGVGYDAQLLPQVCEVIVLMRASKTWDEFKQRVDEALPRCGETLKLPYMAEPIWIGESSSSASEA